MTKVDIMDFVVLLLQEKGRICDQLHCGLVMGSPKAHILMHIIQVAPHSGTRFIIPFADVYWARIFQFDLISKEASAIGMVVVRSVLVTSVEALVVFMGQTAVIMLLLEP
jgi:hypothetical protein